MSQAGRNGHEKDSHPRANHRHLAPDRARDQPGKDSCVLDKTAPERGLSAEACRTLGISKWSFYRWRQKYGGMAKSDAKQLKELEKENAQLKKLLAEKELDNDILKEALKTKF